MYATEKDKEPNDMAIEDRMRAAGFSDPDLYAEWLASRVPDAAVALLRAKIPGAPGSQESLTRVIKRAAIDAWPDCPEAWMLIASYLARTVEEHSTPALRIGTVPQLALIMADQIRSIQSMPEGEKARAQALTGVNQAQLLMDYLGTGGKRGVQFVEEDIHHLTAEEAMHLFTMLVYAASLVIMRAGNSCSCRTGDIAAHMNPLLGDGPNPTTSFHMEITPKAIEEIRKELTAKLHRHGLDFLGPEAMTYLVNKMLPLALEDRERPPSERRSGEEAMLHVELSLADDISAGDASARAYLIDSYRHTRGIIQAARAAGLDPVAAVAAKGLPVKSAGAVVAANDAMAEKIAAGWWFDE